MRDMVENLVFFMLWSASMYNIFREQSLWALKKFRDILQCFHWEKTAWNHVLTDKFSRHFLRFGRWIIDIQARYTEEIVIFMIRDVRA